VTEVVISRRLSMGSDLRDGLMAVGASEVVEVDAEGMELATLNGMGALLERSCRLSAFEWSHPFYSRQVSAWVCYCWSSGSGSTPWR